MVDPTRPESTYTGHDHQEWQRLQRHFNPPSIPSVPSTDFAGVPSMPSAAPYEGASGVDPFNLPTTGGGSRPARPSGPGVIEQLGEGSSNMAIGIMNRVAPLRAAAEAGERLASATPRTKLWLAVTGALIAAGLALGVGVDPAVAVAALVAGAVLGWMLPLLLGFALTFTAFLTGLAIGLGGLALLLWLAYMVFESLSASP